MLPAVRHHHERLDGTSYADRRAGEAIPRAAPIVAVADVHDASTSEREYQSTPSVGRALAHAAAARGTHFDPVCLDASVALVAEFGARPDDAPGALAACHDHHDGHERGHRHRPEAHDRERPAAGAERRCVRPRAQRARQASAASQKRRSRVEASRFQPRWAHSAPPTLSPA